MQYQLLIIGSGPGGYRAADYAARRGMQVAIVEEADAGGTCLNRGCIPTKTLCHEADRLSVIREAMPAAQPDFLRICQRLQDVTTQLRTGVETLMAQPGITLLRGHATFVDAHTVSVTDADGNAQTLTADDIIIATGSLPKLPPGLSLLTADGEDVAAEPDRWPEVVMSSTEMLALDHVPQTLCIVGAGVIGMEMASVYSRFGAEVTVVEFLKECLPAVDSDVAKRLRKQMEREGITFQMQAAVSRVAVCADGQRQVTFADKRGREQQLTAEVVLVATGRRPNTSGLGLEAAGIETGRGGCITVDDNMQTNVPHVYAIGDVNARQMLAHAATMQGLHVVDHILTSHLSPLTSHPSPLTSPLDHGVQQVMPAAIFTSPECACVGLSEDEAKAQGLEYDCRKSFYRTSGRALSMEQTEGLVKLLSLRADGRIIGCHVVGAHAADLVQEVAALMAMRATVSQLAAITHIHPTLSELLQDAALG